MDELGPISNDVACFSVWPDYHHSRPLYILPDPSFGFAKCRSNTRTGMPITASPHTVSTEHVPMVTVAVGLTHCDTQTVGQAQRNLATLLQGCSLDVNGGMLLHVHGAANSLERECPYAQRRLPTAVVAPLPCTQWTGLGRSLRPMQLPWVHHVLGSPMFSDDGNGCMHMCCVLQQLGVSLWALCASLNCVEGWPRSA
jgi:hypothetical protein